LGRDKDTIRPQTFYGIGDQYEDDEVLGKERIDTCNAGADDLAEADLADAVRCGRKILFANLKI
jgi:hypothetical protein